MQIKEEIVYWNWDHWSRKSHGAQELPGATSHFRPQRPQVIWLLYSLPGSLPLPSAPYDLPTCCLFCLKYTHLPPGRLRNQPTQVFHICMQNLFCSHSLGHPKVLSLAHALTLWRAVYVLVVFLCLPPHWSVSPMRTTVFVLFCLLNTLSPVLRTAPDT